MKAHCEAPITAHREKALAAAHAQLLGYHGRSAQIEWRRRGVARYTLVIGNKNYSSWSLRPWLLMRNAGIEFDELRIPLSQPDTRQRILSYSGAGKVPILLHGDLTVWDSFAICEYIAERHPQVGAWPKDPSQRARARSVAAEMHSGFAALRAELPLDCRARHRGVDVSDQARADIERIEALWTDCRLRAGAGPWLFGDFCTADAMYAPVALRFLTYDIGLGDTAREYADSVRNLAAVRDWLSAAGSETEVINDDEHRRP
jgi:glutathione S-transferase